MPAKRADGRELSTGVNGASRVRDAEPKHGDGPIPYSPSDRSGGTMRGFAPSAEMSTTPSGAATEARRAMPKRDNGGSHGWRLATCPEWS